MTTMTKTMAAALALAVLLIGAAPGQARTWTMDNYHSQAIFEIGHVTGKVMGYFNTFEGTVVDPDNPATGSIHISIDVASLSTGVEPRDKHLMTPDFFDVAKYPKITFDSTRIVDIGGGWFEAHGTLTIKDVSRPAVLPYQVFGTKAYPPVPQMECFDVQGIQAHYALDRLDFGVGDGKFAKMGIVDKAVAITINSELLAKRANCE